MPTLLTLDEVTTLFHEFGHALHGLFATVTYPHFAGTNVFRDFVEFPSQVNEMWIYWPEILAAYARHVDTGEPLPREVVEKLHASEAFNQGFATSEYLAASLARPGMALAHRGAGGRRHRRGGVRGIRSRRHRARQPCGADALLVDVLRARLLGRLQRRATTPTSGARCSTPTRSSGSARTAASRARTATGSATRLLGVGGSKDPLEAYRDFRGRDADIQPLLERRGLVA